jgi:dolichol-phosphate mannosyltransferase
MGLAMSRDTYLTLSVVIPAYNEEKNIPGSLRTLWGRLDEAGIDYELVVVNDNSADATGEVLEALSAENPRVRRVDRTPPRGFGRAIRAGLDAATGDVVVIYMADASDDPADVVMYYNEICNGYDCVFGSRFMKGSRTSNYPWFKLLVNRLVNTMMRLMFATRFNDLTNSFKAYRSYVLRECGPYRASHFNITIELSLSALVRNYNILQVPISWQGRTWGSSNLHLKEMGRRYLSTLIKIYFEKILIRDDVIAETLAHRQQAAGGSLEGRMACLEARLEALERQEA